MHETKILADINGLVFNIDQVIYNVSDNNYTLLIGLIKENEPSSTL